MILSAVLAFGFVSQSPIVSPVRASRTLEPVRVWREDSMAYVSLAQPGHLVLLNVDPIGRVTVLFPFGPYDSTDVDAGVPFAVPLPPEAQGNPATIVAVRSRWSFDFSALNGGPGGTWDYQNAWLLQPTGGDPLAALLDIADRVTDGRPYDFGVVAYSRAGTAVARGPVKQPDVCLGCVTQGRVAAASAPAAQTNNVDCTNASLTNAFCGVNSGTVSITSSAPAPQAAYQQPVAEPVYVPYFVPIGVRGFRPRFERPVPRVPMMTPPRSTGAAYPIAPRLTAPSASQLQTFTGRRH